MLTPARTKYRKMQKGRIRGSAKGGNEISFGSVALLSTSSGWVTSKQIEACRVAATRHVKRDAKIWIRIFPDKPITKKPAETRMGSGKGSPEYWVAEVRAGKIIYELTGVAQNVAKEALQRAAGKLPLKSKMVVRSEFLM